MGRLCQTEGLTEEQTEIVRAVRQFVDEEILPVATELEHADEYPTEIVEGLKELGVFGLTIPEEYDGLGESLLTYALCVEEIARGWMSVSGVINTHFIVAYMLMRHGTEEQKQKYLPGLAAGDIVGAYALSESGSGSDALAARARAARQADGSFVLSGEKMWLTNGGFADLFIVFAKVDGEHFSAFIVERSCPGVSSGKEEHKMGLHGSSTTPLILQDVRVPAAALLGEVGKGHKVALNTLNYGRFKLAAMCSGGAKMTVGVASAYAATRRQFNEPIATFGAIRHKLGEMTARIYGVESALYRTTGLIDSSLAEAHDLPGGLEEFAIEASALKVAASEMLDFVVDENVQIHGGNGFVKDYPAERYYRDARVNRIFEGTNEINRLLVPGMLARRAVKGVLPLIAAARALQDELLAPPSLPVSASSDGLSAERGIVNGMKKVGLAVLGSAMQTYGTTLAEQQEVLSFTSDIIMDVFVAESARHRALQAVVDDPSRAALHEAAARVVVHTALTRVEASSREALACLAQGDMLRTLLAAQRRWLKSTPPNLVAARRALADELVGRRRYPFELTR